MLASELSETKIAESFGTRRGVSENAGSESLCQVDLDKNLVESVLESYCGQHGSPGPAGSLAAILDLKLPDAQQSAHPSKEPSDAVSSSTRGE